MPVYGPGDRIPGRIPRPTKPARKTEYRWTVIRDYYTEAGDNCTDSWVILYSNEAEAVAMMKRLNAGGDRSFHDPDDEAAQSFLYVDRITI